jgi:peptidyl-prolyl cis-trans isomerase D
VLDAMRKNADSMMIKALYVIIVLVFIGWGVGTMRGRVGRMEVAARVNDDVITQHQFDETYKRVASMYQSAGQQAPPADFLKGQALSQLIDLELLNQEAARLGLAVDESELRDAIAAAPDFQRDGRFDKDLYVLVLQQNGYKPSDFEEMQRRRLLAGKVRELVRSGVHVTDQEVQDRFRFDNERIDLRFVRVPAAPLMSAVTVSDADVEKFFAENAEKYRQPERVRIAMIEFRPQDFTSQVGASEEDIKAYYDAHIDQYQRPEEVHARQIMFHLTRDAGDEEKAKVRKQAEEVLAKIKAGGDFAELAKQYSQDASAANGGDLGRFGRGVMAPDFEAAAFALDSGQMSGVVETPFGMHIIKVEEKIPPHTEPLEAVRASIVDALAAPAARQLALKKVEEAHDQLLDGKDLAQVAADAGLQVRTPEPFGQNEPIAGVGVRPELAKEAFATDAGEVGEIVTEPSGYTIFTVKERIPSAIPELAAVRKQVEADLRHQRAAAMAKERAEALLAKLKQNPDLDALARDEHLAVEHSDQVGRFGPYVPNLGSVPDLKDAAFRLTPEAPVAPAVYDASGDAIIAVLANRIPADESRFATDKESVRQGILQRAETAALQRFLEQLKTKAQIEYGRGVAGPATAS